jgi:hypothetical protein
MKLPDFYSLEVKFGQDVFLLPWPIHSRRLVELSQTDACLSWLQRCHHFQECLGSRGGRRRILSGDKVPIDDGKGLPVGDLLEVRAEPLQFIFTRAIGLPEL